MTTVAKMIEWLKTQPQDAEVHCGVEVISGHSTYMTYDTVDIEGSKVFDYTDPKWVGGPYAGRIIVQICGE